MTHDDREPPEKPAIKVAVIGGGCASMAAAFELSRPEHEGRFDITVYQLGWRLGGKGASGRGPADRIEEHGLHVWLGFYENAFRLLRECYEELDRDPDCRIATWEDAFEKDNFVGMADRNAKDAWLQWTTYFPKADGLPGDPFGDDNPFRLKSYIGHTVRLLKTLLTEVDTRHSEIEASARADAADKGAGAKSVLETIERLLSAGALATGAGLATALSVLDKILLPRSAEEDAAVVRLLRKLASDTYDKLGDAVEKDDELRFKWEILDLVIAILVGILRDGIMTNPRGFEVIDDKDCREWLLENGASTHSVDSSFVRGLYDLAMAYPDGDSNRPQLAAGQAVRGSLRMFFTYRGALFWKMTAGMGDVVFAPFYEVLKKRGVRFEFFHRLENVGLSEPGEDGEGSSRHVKRLEFDVQAETVDGEEYRPLVDVRGLPCWPSLPDYSQLKNGDAARREQWDFESFWDRNRAGTKTLDVGEDFDFVVLGVGVGAIPYVCAEIVDSDERWRDMVQHVTSVPTQAFQVWLSDDLESLGWHGPGPTLSAFAKPFDTWSDMTHLVDEESFSPAPGSIAYFCSVMPDEGIADRDDVSFPERCHEKVRRSAIDYLNTNVRHLWPDAVDDEGAFRWELLVTPDADTTTAGESRFGTQYWTANVNPSDRYTLALPGSLQYRISPLDNTYDNLTIAGDWTDCGFNEGCVEAAVMSGRLAAHALCEKPKLEDIVGYDYP